MAITSGPVTERILGPTGAEIRSRSYPDAFSDFTPLLGDPLGVYSVVAETASGEFKTTFTVTDVSPKLIASRERKIERIWRDSGGMGLQDATHLFVYGFNPGEVLDLEFYTACRATGPRRGEGLSFSRITGGQIRVNGDGYAFVSIPPDIKAAGWTVLYALLGRATCAPTAEAARVGALLVDAKRRDRELGG